KTLENTGIVVKGVKYDVRISCVIADAPARSFIKATKNHNAYFACDKCEVEGEWDGRVILNELTCAKRSDLGFRTKSNPYHHVGNSPLLDLKFGLVSQVPID